MISDLNERKIPIFFNILLIGIMIFRFWQHQGNVDIKHYFEGYLISNIILFLAVFLKQKISIHITAYASIIPFFIYVSGVFYKPFLMEICLSIVLLGILMSARLYLKAHTNKEVILGVLSGIIPQIIIYKI